MILLKAVDPDLSSLGCHPELREMGDLVETEINQLPKGSGFSLPIRKREMGNSGALEGPEQSQLEEGFFILDVEVDGTGPDARRFGNPVDPGSAVAVPNEGVGCGRRDAIESIWLASAHWNN